MDITTADLIRMRDEAQGQANKFFDQDDENMGSYFLGRVGMLNEMIILSDGRAKMYRGATTTFILPNQGVRA